MPIRRAEMLRDLARETPIAIYPGERIVGNRSLLPRMGVIAPEGAVDWIDRELEILPTRPQDQFNITPEEIETLRERCVPLLARAYAGRHRRRARPADIMRAVKARAFSLNQTDHAQGHILPDVEAWLRLGIGGLRARVEAGARQHPDDPQAAIFYEAAGIALDAAALLMRRYARLAAAMARDETDPDRRCELAEIAVRCRRLAAQPPTDFIEALQAIWFLFVLLQMESNASSFSPGRLDQYLLPYLERDLASGALTLMRRRAGSSCCGSSSTRSCCSAAVRARAISPVSHRLQRHPGRADPRRRGRHQPAQLHVPARPGRCGNDAAQPLDPHPPRQPAAIPARRSLRDRARRRHAPGVQRRGDHPGPDAPRR